MKKRPRTRAERPKREDDPHHVHTGRQRSVFALQGRGHVRGGSGRHRNG
jgi:hypothetical protein